MKITFEDMKDMNVPKYCRKLMKGEYPKTLGIYRGDMLCLTVDVEKASKLRMVENEKQGPFYRKHRVTDFKSIRKAVPLQSLVS